MAGQKIGDAFIDIGARFDKLNKGLKQTTSKIESGFSKLTPKLDKQFVNLGKTFAAAFAAREIINFTTEALKLAAAAEGIEKAFKELNEPQLLSNLQKATKGTVTNLKLMQFAVKASHFRIPLQELAGFLEFATKRANETGMAMDGILQSMITAVGRGSLEVWDNFGFSLDRVRKNLNGVSVETLTVAERTKLMGRLISEEMTGAADSTMTAGQELQKMQADIENLKVKIGSSLMPVMLTLLSTTNEVAQGFKILFSDATIESEQFSKALKEGFHPQVLAEARMAFSEILKDVKGQKGEFIAIEGLIKKNKKVAENLLKLAESSYGSLKDQRLEEAAILTVLNQKLQKRIDLATATKAAADANTGIKLTFEEQLKLIQEQEKAAKDLQRTFNSVGKEVEKLMNFTDNRGSLSSIFGATDDSPIQEIASAFEEGEVFEDLDKFNHKMQQAAINQRIAAGAAMGFGMALTDSLAGALDGSENFFDSMLDRIKQLIIKLVAAAAAAAVLTAILSASTGGAALLTKLGSFKGLFGTFAGIDLGGVVRGNDIVVSNQRQLATNNRFGG